MKKTVTLLAFIFGTCMSLRSQVQTSVADFENFNTGSNITYTNSANAPFQTSNAEFNHEMAGSYWIGGFSYTNKYDSSTASFANLHGVKAYKGYNNSSMYNVGQNHGVIKLKAPFNSADGFYITNTTFTYKTIRDGNQFSRKFGDTTGTGSGSSIAQGSYPDWFKITIKGYFNGSLKNDSVEYYLADYRFSNNSLDYIIGSWQWINTSTLGQVDSIKFFMYSSDVGQFGINTPLFFAIDNFTTSNPYVGIAENSGAANPNVYPNPFNSEIIFIAMQKTVLTITDVSGRNVFNSTLEEGNNRLDLDFLNKGIYFATLHSAGKTFTQKIIKE